MIDRSSQFALDDTASTARACCSHASVLLASMRSRRQHKPLHLELPAAAHLDGRRRPWPGSEEIGWCTVWFDTVLYRTVPYRLYRTVPYRLYRTERIIPYQTAAAPARRYFERVLECLSTWPRRALVSADGLLTSILHDLPTIAEFLRRFCKKPNLESGTTSANCNGGPFHSRRS